MLRGRFVERALGFQLCRAEIAERGVPSSNRFTRAIVSESEGQRLQRACIHMLLNGR